MYVNEMWRRIAIIPRRRRWCSRPAGNHSGHSTREREILLTQTSTTVIALLYWPLTTVITRAGLPWVLEYCSRNELLE